MAAETTYGIDPSANGSGYVWIPDIVVGQPQNAAKQAETNFLTNRVWPTAPEVQAQAAKVDIEFPWYGLSAAAGDLTAPPASDWLSLILRNAIGARLSQSGRNVAAGSSTSNLILASAAWTDQNLALVYQASLLSPDRAETRRLVLASGATYNLGGGNWTSAPGATAVAYGGEMYAPEQDSHGSLAVHVAGDGWGRTLLGGFVDSLKIHGKAGELVKMSAALSFDNDVLETKSALPTVGNGPGYEASKGVLGAATINGTAYAIAGFELDLGRSTADVAALTAAQGRSSKEQTSQHPVLTLTPLYLDAFLTLKKNGGTDVAALVKWGSGVLSGGRINSGAFFAPVCRILEATQSEDGAILRHTLKLHVYDGGILSGSVIQRPFTLGRF